MGLNQMQLGRVPKLYRVPTSLIRIDGRRLRPTPWDKAVVYKDLQCYMQKARRLASTPEISFDAGQLFLVSGEPFFNAASALEPPIDSIICMSTGERPIELERVERTYAHEVLDSEEKSVGIPIPTMVFFTKHLDHDEIGMAIDTLRSKTSPLLNHVEIDADRVGTRTILHWSMPPLDVDDSRFRVLLSAFCQEFIVRFPVSSINGISIEVACSR